jgi:RNA polymerase sigma-70 factor, ECF subfamily
MDTPTSRSLLQRARDPADSASWRRLTDLYTPLIRRWVRANLAQPADADDLVQEVLTTLVRELPRFEHNQRPGAFRAWLRSITLNRLREQWNSRRGDRQGTGDDAMTERLNQLEDPESPLARAWDEEHDRHVAQTLLESIRLEFQPATWLAFQQTVCEGRLAADVAAELGISVNAVLIGKSRVLKRLRQNAGDLLD